MNLFWSLVDNAEDKVMIIPLLFHSLLPTLSLSHTHTQTQTHTHALTRTFTFFSSHSFCFSLTKDTHTYTHTLSLTHTLSVSSALTLFASLSLTTHTHLHALFISFTHSLTLFIEDNIEYKGKRLVFVVSQYWPSYSRASGTGLKIYGDKTQKSF